LEEIKNALPEPKLENGMNGELKVDYKNWEEEEQVSGRHVAEFKAIFDHFQVKDDSKAPQKGKEDAAKEEGKVSSYY